MRSLKLNFSATVLTLGLKAKIFENLRLCQAKIWGELRTRATFDRCVGSKSPCPGWHWRELSRVFLALTSSPVSSQR